MECLRPFWQAFKDITILFSFDANFAVVVTLLFVLLGFRLTTAVPVSQTTPVQLTAPVSKTVPIQMDVLATIAPPEAGLAPAVEDLQTAFRPLPNQLEELPHDVWIALP